MKSALRIMTYRFVAFLILVYLVVSNCFAQSTIGIDFWVTFMPNGTSNSNPISLDLVSTSHCNSMGTVTNEYTGFSSDFEVLTNEVTTINLPEEIAYFGEQSDVVLHNAFHVTATDEIALYASNYRMASYDVGKLLPTDALGSEYVLQTYPSDGMYDYACPVFAVIAVEDNTEVLINLTSDSKGGHYANQPFTVVLDKGECYQVQAFSDGDFSGTWLRAGEGKHIAVFAGSTGVVVPIGHYAYDAIFEQMPPIERWGKRFVVTSSMERKNDRVRVTALHDDCKVYKDGALLATLDARQTAEFGINNVLRSAIYLETTEPALVYLYTTSMSYGDVNQSTGDPSMVNIPPVEQATGNYAVIPVLDQGGWCHIVYVNIVTKTENVEGVCLDGVCVASSFEEVPGLPEYSYARLPLTLSSHVLMSTTGNFIAHTYGFGPAQSYAFVVGTKLMGQITVNEEPSSNHPQGFEACEEEVMTFGLQPNIESTSVQWNFGDGDVAQGYPINHVFDSAGVYGVTCEVYVPNQLQPIALNTSVIVHQKYHIEEERIACDSYEWNGETYTESGVYNYQGESIYGCDSTFVLHLVVNYDVVIDTVVTACEEFVWYGETYTSSGQHEQTLQTSMGCDSIVRLNLTINHAQQLTLQGSALVYAATNLVEGIYDYRVTDSMGIAPGSLIWSCTVPEWEIRPSESGFRCKLRVTVPGQGTLSARIDKDCDVSFSLDIFAEWFDIEENRIMKISVFPNPAKDELNIDISGLSEHNEHRIQITDALGHICLDRIIRGEGNVLMVGVASLPAGMYSYQIYDNKKTLSSGKFVKE